MHEILVFSIIFIIGEILATFIFLGLNQFFIRDMKKSKITRVALVKGILERFLLFFAFTYNVFLVLTFFGAIKIGTRLESDKENKVSNDYFMVGNFVSALLAFLYYVIYEKMI